MCSLLVSLCQAGLLVKALDTRKTTKMKLLPVRSYNIAYRAPGLAVDRTFNNGRYRWGVKPCGGISQANKHDSGRHYMQPV
jgi:hypothetical protein